MRALGCLVIVAVLLMVPWGWPILIEGKSEIPQAAAKITTAPAPTASPTVTAMQRDNGELWVEVDQRNQVVKILRGLRVIRAMLASTGRDDAPTPNGQFRIMDRGDWFFSEQYEQGAYFWVAFDDKAEFLFHSVPFDRQGKMIEAEATLLGQQASHGCVRLTLDDARWFYENIPVNTRVVIHN